MGVLPSRIVDKAASFATAVSSRMPADRSLYRTSAFLKIIVSSSSVGLSFYLCVPPLLRYSFVEVVFNSS